jgi:hypothetical protein
VYRFSEIVDFAIGQAHRFAANNAWNGSEAIFHGTKTKQKNPSHNVPPPDIICKRLFSPTDQLIRAILRQAQVTPAQPSDVTNMVGVWN